LSVSVRAGAAVTIMIGISLDSYPFQWQMAVFSLKGMMYSMFRKKFCDTR